MNKNHIFYVEGPDWQEKVYVNQRYKTLRTSLFDAGTRAIRRKLQTDDLNLGGVVIVKRGRKNSPEYLVNAYICLKRAGMPDTARKLRQAFKDQMGMDLAEDKVGYSKV